MTKSADIQLTRQQELEASLYAHWQASVTSPSIKDGITASLLQYDDVDCSSQCAQIERLGKEYEDSIQHKKLVFEGG